MIFACLYDDHARTILDGGQVHRTFLDAQSFCGHSQQIFGVLADWDKDTFNGYLQREAKVVKPGETHLVELSLRECGCFYAKTEKLEKDGSVIMTYYPKLVPDGVIRRETL